MASDMEGQKGKMLRLAGGGEYDLNILKSAQQGMKQIWEDGDLFDITLEVDGHSIRAHKVVLARHSPYFRVMFCGRFQDAQKNSIELKGLSRVLEMFHLLSQVILTNNTF